MPVLQITGANILAILPLDDIELRLANLARKTGRKKTFYEHEAILKYLDYLEDLYLASERLVTNI